MMLFHAPGYVIADTDKALQVEGWDEVVFDQKRPNHFTARNGGGIEVTSRGSVSLLQMPVTIDIKTRATLRWRWCVVEPAPATNLSTKGSDDRSLAFYVAFPFVAKEATAFERIERKIVEARAGKDAPGRVLMYVWGGEEDRGTVVDSPHLGSSGMMKILRPANTPAGQWFTENIDIVDDYRRAFGNDPPNPMYIAISADTDDTQSISKGTVMGIEFIDTVRAF